MENTNTEMNPIFQQRHCPNCGGNSFTFSKDKSAFVCDYCGSEFVVEGLNKGIVIHNEKNQEDDDSHVTVRDDLEDENESPVTESSYSSYSPFHDSSGMEVAVSFFYVILGGIMMGGSMLLTNNPDILPVSVETRELLDITLKMLKITAFPIMILGVFHFVRSVLCSRY